MLNSNACTSFRWISLWRARFLKAYLDRALYKSLGPPDGVVAEALTVAIVVTYARSFTANRNRFKKRDLCPSFLTASLSDKQRGLHDHIVNERHQAFAHSDAGWQKIRVVATSDDPHLTVSYGKVPLEQWEAKPLLEIVRKIQAVLEPRLERPLSDVFIRLAAEVHELREKLQEHTQAVLAPEPDLDIDKDWDSVSDGAGI